jgi:hypothetical protein
MDYFLDKLEAIEGELKDKVKELVEAYGNKDGFKTEKVIDLEPILMDFVYVCGKEMIYMAKDKLYSKDGYEYSYNCLEILDFAQLVDAVNDNFDIYVD